MFDSHCLRYIIVEDEVEDNTEHYYEEKWTDGALMQQYGHLTAMQVVEENGKWIELIRAR